MKTSENDNQKYRRRLVDGERKRLIKMFGFLKTVFAFGSARSPYPTLTSWNNFDPFRVRTSHKIRMDDLGRTFGTLLDFPGQK